MIWIRVGLGASAIYLQYSRAASVNWRAITRAASVSTDTDTTIAAATGWIHYAIDIESSSAVKFYLNNVLVATNTTNIPAATARLIAQSPVNVCVQKTVGTTSRYFESAGINWRTSY